MAAQPQITKYAKNLKRRQEPIQERLTRYQHLYADNIKTLKQQYEPSVSTNSLRRIANTSPRLCTPRSCKENNPEEYSFQPSISPKSRILASKVGTSRERLLRNSNKVLPSCVDSECSFSPSINSVSKDGHKTVKQDRCLRLYEGIQGQKIRREELL